MCPFIVQLLEYKFYKAPTETFLLVGAKNSSRQGYMYGRGSGVHRRSTTATGQNLLIVDLVEQQTTADRRGFRLARRE